MNEGYSTVCKQYLCKKLHETESTDFIQELSEVLKFISETVLMGETNSVLINKPFDSDNTEVKNVIISKIENEKLFENNYLLVELHGLFHKNDSLAFREICWKLDIDIPNSADFENDFTSSAADLLSFALRGLNSNKSTSKSIIFIFEQVEKFCSSHSQILYNLLNVAQSYQLPICIIGITAKRKIREMLECRINSRFMGKEIYLHWNDFEKRLLDIQFLLSIDNSCKLPLKFRNSWNKNIEKLIKDPAFISFMKELFNESKNAEFFKNILYFSLTKINEDHSFLELKDFEDAANMFRFDKKVLLQSLSTLETCLMISIAHHIDNYQTPFNFEIIYDSFNKFAQKSCSLVSVSKFVAMKAFETLYELDLIYSIDCTQTISKEFVMYESSIDSESIKKEIMCTKDLLSEVKQYASSSI